nr:MAG TPA: hypothetical protein [Caudoviricetes sp.]
MLFVPAMRRPLRAGYVQFSRFNFCFKGLSLVL